MNFLTQPIEQLPGTRPITIKKLKLLEINTFHDLLHYYPSRYENFTVISSINKLQEGEVVTVKGKIIEAKNTYTRRGMTIQKVRIEDATGQIEIAWYNQPYLISLFKAALFVSVSGEVKKFLHTHTISPKSYETLKTLDQTTVHTGRIVPIYPEKKGTSTKTVREKVYKVLNQMILNKAVEPLEMMEWMPKEILKLQPLMSESEAIQLVHFPETTTEVGEARRRLSFDELFVVRLSAALIRRDWLKETVTKQFDLEKHQKKLDDFIAKLPFTLTNAQNKVYKEILGDLLKTSPMNRFVQGDVGSGKTVVAAIACYLAYLNGYQSLVMAPTEILAQQHFHTLTKLFAHTPVKIGIQTGSKKLTASSDTKVVSDIIVGTQALLSEKMKFENVGLVIIDEQHRFGVAQRAQLKKKGINPHLLTMTATPIPRTIALTLYGELEMSVIDEMPKGRLPIKTFLVPKEKRESGYTWIKNEIKTKGSQVFIVCPLIEESEVETMVTVKAVKKEYEHLKDKVFADCTVGLLHGKMKPKEKEAVMADFKNKNYDILVTTSVVEVGIDVPNASVMIIEGAERYGLAQLHQLRGRVGRGSEQSYCLLYTSEDSEASTGRLQFFSNTLSGIDLAEFDYKIRGPGDIFGTSQHGYADLKIANLGDFQLIEQTKKSVLYFMEHLDLNKFPIIKQKVEQYRVDQIARD